MNIDGDELLAKTLKEMKWGGSALTIVIIGLLALLFLFIAANTSSRVGIPLFILLIAGGVIVFIVNQSNPTAVVYEDDLPDLTDYIERTGARSAFDSEMEQILYHLNHISKQGAGNVSVPEDWYVVHDPMFWGTTLGDSAFLGNTIFNSEFLGAIVAEQVARIHHKDGRIQLALHHIGKPVDQLPYAQEWRAYLEQQTLRADEFVANVGYCGKLIEMLEFALQVEGNVPLNERNTPLIGERIERLREFQAEVKGEGEAEVTEKTHGSW